MKEDVSERNASGRQSSFTDRNTGTSDESSSASKNDSNDIRKTPVRGRPQGVHSLYPTGDQNVTNDRSAGYVPASLSGKSENESASQAAIVEEK